MKLQGLPLYQVLTDETHDPEPCGLTADKRPSNDDRVNSLFQGFIFMPILPFIDNSTFTNHMNRRHEKLEHE